MSQTLQCEEDIYAAVSKMKYLTKSLPFTESEVQSVVVALMEAARNVLDHAGGPGQLTCGHIDDGIFFTISDQGPGISDVQSVLSGQFQSATGLGLGLSGAKRLMDELHIDTSMRGTKIHAVKRYNRKKR